MTLFCAICADFCGSTRGNAPSNRPFALYAKVKPHDLPADQSVAYDVAFALVNGGVLPEPCDRLAVDSFGQPGASEPIYLVGLNARVSMTLNGFDVTVPEGDRDM